MKLEIGPGKTKIGIDWKTFGMENADIIGNLEDKLPFPNNSFDLVYMSHVLEHVRWWKTVAVLKEVYRILSPDGVIEIWVPDFEYIVKCYLNKRCGDEWRKYNSDNDFMTWINGRIFTYGEKWNWHRCIFDYDSLNKNLRAAGFKNIFRLTKPRGYDHGVINLGVGGMK